MKTSIDTNSPVPVRTQLRSILVEEIRAGVYPPNQRIPSERDLAGRYGASRASVREAMTEMISAGLLYRAAGRGTFVAEIPQEAQPLHTALQQVAFWISAEIFHFVEAGYTRILTGVEEVCRAEGLSLNFYSVSEERDSLDRVFQDGPQNRMAIGHVVAGGLRRATLERVQNLGKPMVIVDSMTRRKVDGIDLVRIDYASGTRDAVQHLAELGHREIGFIGFASSEKYEAYWRALEELGLPYSPRFVQFLDMPDLSTSIVVGFQCMNNLLAGSKRPSALLVANDNIALGTLEALSIAGVPVPEQMSIVGFDDLGQRALPLTTVRCDLVETGRIAARNLIERLRNPQKTSGEVIVPVRLVVRGSTAPHASPSVALEGILAK
jgi:DNA-binding LacI/PurR family transcriptional regulator